MSRLVLIDTHILLWAVAEPERLSETQMHMLQDASIDIAVSAISVAEIEIKRAIGKLDMSHSCDDLRRSIEAQWLPLDAGHAMALRELPLVHRDPFDRMLVAQAIAESITFITSDAVLDGYVASGLEILH